LFQNLRATRESELAATYPLHVVTAWIGNTARIAERHYLQVPDEFFEKASGVKKGTKECEDRQAAQNPAQYVAVNDGRGPQTENTRERQNALLGKKRHCVST